MSNHDANVSVGRGIRAFVSGKGKLSEAVLVRRFMGNRNGFREIFREWRCGCSGDRQGQWEFCAGPARHLRDAVN
jgi:hypothetical protein